MSIRFDEMTLKELVTLNARLRRIVLTTNDDAQYAYASNMRVALRQYAGEKFGRKWLWAVRKEQERAQS